MCHKVRKYDFSAAAVYILHANLDLFQSLTVSVFFAPKLAGHIIWTLSYMIGSLSLDAASTDRQVTHFTTGNNEGKHLEMILYPAIIHR